MLYGDIDFKDLEKNSTIRTQEKRISAPSRQDYLEHLARLFATEPHDLLASDARFTLAIHQHWHHQALQGCHFAQLLAKDPAENGWSRTVLFNRVTSNKSQVWELISDLIDKVSSDDITQSYSLLFPMVDTPEAFVRLLAGLRKIEGWSVNASGEVRAAHWSLIRLKIKIRIMPGDFSAWVLSFGPFPFMPTTRCSPIVELALRPKRKPQQLQHESLTPGEHEAHLADQRIDRLDALKYQKILDATKRRKKLLSENDIAQPKARVAAFVPKKLWKELA